jgi:hypothetical protein
MSHGQNYLWMLPLLKSSKATCNHKVIRLALKGSEGVYVRYNMCML